MRTPFVTLTFITLLALSCSKDPAEPTTPARVFVTFNDNALSVDNFSAGNGGHGLDVTASNERYQFSVRLNDIKPGSYTINDQVVLGTTVSMTGLITWSDFRGIALATDGTLELKLDNGLYSGTYDVQTKTNTGSVALHLKGFFDNLEMIQPATGECRVESADYPGYGKMTFRYDAQGRMTAKTEQLTNNSVRTFLMAYHDDELIAVRCTGTNLPTLYTIDGVIQGKNTDGSNEIAYRYETDGTGKLVQIFKGQQASCVTVTDDNLLRLTDCKVPAITEYVVSGFDSKPSPGSVVIKSLKTRGLAMMFNYIGDVNLEIASVNNAAKIEKKSNDAVTETTVLTYVESNSKGYPLTVKKDKTVGSSTSSVNVKYTYINCQ